MGTVPLTTLLSWAWIAHVIEADNAFEAACSGRMRRPFRISLAMWANGLRCIEEDGTTVHELHALTRAACNLGGLERWGWISVGHESDRAGASSVTRRTGYGSHRGITESTVLRPTRAGSFARRVWPDVVDRVERAWRERFGSRAVDALREVLGDLGPAMPWAPPEVHPSDGFWTHVQTADTGGRPDDDAAPNECLAALLGRALTKLTLDHESRSRTSLPLAANGLRLLGEGPVRIRDLPLRSGVSKEAIAMMTGFLARRGLAAVAPGRTISLAPSGVEALHDYQRRAMQSTQEGLRIALERVLIRSDALAAGLTPPAGVWRGEPPYLGQTTRLVADPTAALPWHPMVLHRGGWPDGS